MIPKIIHYCWFGPEQKSDETISCIESWKKHNSDFEIKEWNELNFSVENLPFASRMYSEKKWAFVVDHVRLAILETHGGFYLDTDMLLLQSLSPLCVNECILGEEKRGIISAGMIGAIPHHPFITECKKMYDENPQELITIPRILSKVFDTYEHKGSLTILPPLAFYPFDSEHIKEWHGQEMEKDVYGIHLWHYSWGNPLNRLFKNMGIHSLGVTITETLGIKELLKKIFKFV